MPMSQAQFAEAELMVNTDGARNDPPFTYLNSNDNNFGAKYALNVIVTRTQEQVHTNVPVQSNKDWLTDNTEFRAVIQNAIESIIRKVSGRK